MKSMSSSWRSIVGALFVLLALVLTPSEASAQCYLGGRTEFVNPYQHASTIESFSSTRFWTSNPNYAYVVNNVGCPSPPNTGDISAESWISGYGTDACVDSYIYGSVCRGDASTGYSLTWAGARNYSSGTFYGNQMVQGAHRIIYQGGSYTWLSQLTWQTYDFGMTPEEECWANNGTWVEPICYYSPIIVPTGKSQRFKLSSPEEGVLFDMNGDGTVEQTSWIAAGEDLAFLAIDRNSNGVIDNGTELLGNGTVDGAPTGFDALRILAGDEITGSNAILDDDDPLFHKLLLWTDANHNGVSEPTELKPFKDGFSAIGLGYRNAKRRDGHGNLFKYQGYVMQRTAPGQNPVQSAQENKDRSRVVFDVLFQLAK